MQVDEHTLGHRLGSVRETMLGWRTQREIRLVFGPTAKRCRGGRPFSAGYVRNRALGAQPPTANWTCAVTVGSVQTVIARHMAAVHAICQDVGIVAVTATSVHLERTAAMASGKKRSHGRRAA